MVEIRSNLRVSNWRFPIQRGTPFIIHLSMGFSNKNHPAIGVPPWLWKPPIGWVFLIGPDEVSIHSAAEDCGCSMELSFQSVWVTEIGAVATDWVTGGKDVHTIFVIPIGGIWIIGWKPHGLIQWAELPRSGYDSHFSKFSSGDGLDGLIRPQPSPFSLRVLAISIITG